MKIAKIIQCLFFFVFALCFNSISQNTKKPNVLDTIYGCTPVIKAATFTGGLEELQKTLNKNVIYPPEAIKNNYEGRAVIRFVVDKEGAIKEPKLMQGACLYYGLGEEALRIISTMPKWIPGERNGRKVSYRYYTQLTFSTQSQSQLLAIVQFDKFPISDSSCNKVLFW